MGHFGFFQLIKNYAETTLIINKKTMSQEASYTVIDYQVEKILLYWFLEINFFLKFVGLLKGLLVI